MFKIEGIKNDLKNILFSVFALLCFCLGWGQTFTLSGDIITQTGTASNYSGLESITGVTLTTIGSDEEQKNIYNLGNKQLLVNGTLTINPRKEQLIFGDGLITNIPQIEVTGTLTIIDEENYGTGNNTKVFYAKNTPFVFTRTVGYNWVYNNMHISIVSNGTLNLYGVNLDLTGNRGIYYASGSHGTIKDVLLRGGHNGSPRIYLLGDQIVDGLDVYDFQAINLDSYLQEFKNVTPHNVEFSIFFNGDPDENRVIEVEDFDFYSGTDPNTTYYTIIGQNSIKWQMKNKVTGTEGFISVLRGNLGDNYVVEILQDIDFTLSDIEGNVVEATVYTSDIDNGQRKNYTAGNSTTNTTYTSNRTYNQTTTGGKAEFRDILTAAIVVNNTSDAGKATETNPIPAQIDYRTKTTDGTDFLDFYIHSYGYLPRTVPFELRGSGVKQHRATILKDRNIFEADKSIVDAYTEIETLNKLYDLSRAWKVDNVSAEYPAIDSQLITITGTNLDLGSQNLVIDANASQAFSVNTSTNTITIKASSLFSTDKFSSITTTGTVTAQNGATTEFGYVDSSGKNVLLDFHWGAPDIYDVVVIDLNDNSTITTFDDQQQSVKGIFVSPTPFGSGVKVDLFTDKNDSSTLFYTTTLTDSETLEFSRRSGGLHDISSDTTGAAQHEALFLARKILQKTETMSAALEGTTPSLGDDTTTTTSGEDATKENQEAIKDLLMRILIKTTTTHEALKGAN
jgi:hypothetical protein